MDQLILSMSCIDSVVVASRQNTYHIIVIDDRSTDETIVNYLKSKEMAGEIELLTNDHNLGFVRTVNRGMAISKNRDVMLPNSDTVVYGPWAERMQCGAYSNKRIAIVNPLSNGAMSNYPTLGRDGVDGCFEVGDDVLNDLCL
jgi:GT2 family glycosyltransferase